MHIPEIEQICWLERLTRYMHLSRILLPRASVYLTMPPILPALTHRVAPSLKFLGFSRQGS